MWGRPQRSRTTVTGRSSPVTVSVPSTCGRGAGVRGAGGAGRPHAESVSANSHKIERRMALKDTLLSEFDHEMGTTRRLLERIPDEKFEWKPHEKSMPLGGLATHLSNLPNWGTTILNDVSYDLAAGPPNLTQAASRAEVLSHFDAATVRTRTALDKTDAELAAPWKLKRGDQELFSLPRSAAFRMFVLYHIVHHRGQLSVYLRLNDVPVPAIYGPTADEG
jgi:uncharacterized damage-inducible protein DinB